MTAAARALARNRASCFVSGPPGYDAAVASTKRAAPTARVRHEDKLLKSGDRRKLATTTRDLVRNYSLVAWAIRKHLDYNSIFRLQLQTADKGLNANIEDLFAEWSLPGNCDAAGRHPFSGLLRMLEAHRTIDGDVFAIKRANGRLQCIESDRIGSPSGQDAPGWFNGVQLNRDGRALRYRLLNRRDQSSGYDHARDIAAQHVLQHAFLDRIDQVRGISPIASAVNTWRDSYSIVDLALAKMKVEQLFALVINSSSRNESGEYTRTGNGRYTVDMGAGPLKLELDNDDQASFLSSNNPGNNTREFLNDVIGMALKSLDLPLAFADESRTNFFGSRAAWMLYNRSCTPKRATTVELLRKITVWKLRTWILQGRLTLPAGDTIRSLPFEWVHEGMPWWDPQKEISGAVAAMQAGLDNPYRLVKETGRGSFEENIDALARAKAYAESRGVSLAFALPDEPPPDVDDSAPDTSGPASPVDDQEN